MFCHAGFRVRGFHGSELSDHDLKNQIEADKNYDFCNNSVPPAHGPSRLEAQGRWVDDTDFQS